MATTASCPPRRRYPRSTPSLVLAVAAIALGACSLQRSPLADLEGGRYFLCCNVRFNNRLSSTDANYRYPHGGANLPVGTRVTVVEVGSWHVVVRPATDSKEYAILLRYGRELVEPAVYFRDLLRETDPLPVLGEAPQLIRQAIVQAEIVPGMTREQVIMARGYPPRHRTASLDDDEWILYENPHYIDRVSFRNGEVVAVVRGPAP